MKMSLVTATTMLLSMMLPEVMSTSLISMGSILLMVMMILLKMILLVKKNVLEMSLLMN